jgi:hypothetical protein
MLCSPPGNESMISETETYEQAKRRGERVQPRAVAVRYDRRARRIEVELSTGLGLTVPVAMLEELSGATAAQLSGGRVRGGGTALRWDELDADIYVPALYRGLLGSAAWMAELGRAGGRVRSERKAEAARANGRKGGRPRGDSHRAN